MDYIPFSLHWQAIANREYSVQIELKPFNFTEFDWNWFDLLYLIKKKKQAKSLLFDYTIPKCIILLIIELSARAAYCHLLNFKSVLFA